MDTASEAAAAFSIGGGDGDGYAGSVGDWSVGLGEARLRSSFGGNAPPPEISPSLFRSLVKSNDNDGYGDDDGDGCFHDDGDGHGDDEHLQRQARSSSVRAWVSILALPSPAGRCAAI